MHQTELVDVERENERTKVLIMGRGVEGCWSHSSERGAYGIGVAGMRNI
jgi:hypothetical protein